MTNKSLKTQKRAVPLIDFSKFRGKEVALVGGKIVAEGKTSKEAFENAKRIFPKKLSKEIILLFVPKEEIFVYFIL